MSHLRKREKDLIDLLVYEQHQYKVTIRDGSSGSSGDDYTIVINEKDFEDEPQGNRGNADGPDPVFEDAFVVEDGSPNSDTSNTIASDLQTAISKGDKPVTASVSGSTVTIRETEPHMNLEVNLFTTDSNGSITMVQEAAEAYELQHASDWDGTFSTLLDIPRNGGTSSSASADPAPTGSEHSTLRNWVRYRLAPSDYGSLDDNSVEFFRLAPVFDGTTQSANTIFFIPTVEMMYDNHPSVVLDGDAPKAADRSSAREIRFPFQTSSVRVKNLSSEYQYISFGEGSGEWKLGGGDVFSDNKLGTRSIRMRTDNSAPSAGAIQAYVTLNTHPIF